MADDPLKAIDPFDTMPQTRRRAMNAEEIHRLVEACVTHR